MKIFGIPIPRRTLDWLELSRRSCTFTLIVVAVGLFVSVTSAAQPIGASDAHLRLTDIAIFLAIGGQTAAIAFFIGGLAARVMAIEEWRREHIEWSERVVEKNQEAHDEFRRQGR